MPTGICRRHSSVGLLGLVLVSSARSACGRCQARPAGRLEPQPATRRARPGPVPPGWRAARVVWTGRRPAARHKVTAARPARTASPWSGGGPYRNGSGAAPAAPGRPFPPGCRSGCDCPVTHLRKFGTADVATAPCFSASVCPVSSRSSVVRIGPIARLVASRRPPGCADGRCEPAARSGKPVSQGIRRKA